MSEKWDRRFLEMAQDIAGWSKDPSTKVGAVMVRDRRLVCTGYNGLPSAVADDPAVLHDRERKYRLIVHAEENCVAQAAKFGTSLDGATCYTWPLFPCSKCGVLMAQAGVKRVVSLHESFENPRWAESFAESRRVLEECGVEISLY